MINKDQRLKLLNHYDKKEDKMFLGSILDKVNKYESEKTAVKGSTVTSTPVSLK